jgi:hypothetical protein
MKALEEVLESSDKDLIHLRLDQLNEFTQPLLTGNGQCDFEGDEGKKFDEAKLDNFSPI